MAPRDRRRYQISGVLGQGGQGIVYLAESQGKLRQKVAIKMLTAEWAKLPGQVERFHDEAQLLARLDQSAFVQVRELEKLDGVWCLVMEYVEGCDVRALLANGPIPPKPAMAIASKVAEALYVAHFVGPADGAPLRLIHRDIKPSNVRLRRTGDVKVLDFGVARGDFARSADTTQGALGTHAYMAPERWSREDEHTSDIYALGVMLFEMMTGVPPGRVHGDPDRKPPGHRLSQQWAWVRGLDPRVERLILRMTADLAEERPNGREVAEELDRIAAVLPGAGLAAWAEEHVKPGPPGRADGWLTETILEPVAARRALPWAAAGVVGAAVLCAGLGAAAAAAWRWGGVGTQPEAEMAAAPAPAATGGAGPAVEAAATKPEAAALAVPKAVVPPVESQPTEPVSRPAEVRVDPPKPVEPKGDSPKLVEPEGAAPKPETPKAATPKPGPQAPVVDVGTLTVTGDAVSVRLTGAGGSRGPGTVPAGAWTVVATFASGVSHSIPVTVRAGATTTVKCKEAFGCRVQ